MAEVSLVWNWPIRNELFYFKTFHSFDGTLRGANYVFWIGYVFVKDATIESGNSECSFKYVEYLMHRVCLNIP